MQATLPPYPCVAELPLLPKGPTVLTMQATLPLTNVVLVLTQPCCAPYQTPVATWVCQPLIIINITL
jgi:hypothetical protein